MKLVHKIHDYTRHIKNSSNCAGRLPFYNCENGIMDSLRHMSQLSATVDIGLFTQSQPNNGTASSLNISCLNISRVLDRLQSRVSRHTEGKRKSALRDCFNCRWSEGSWGEGRREGGRWRGLPGQRSPRGGKMDNLTLWRRNFTFKF